MEKHLHIVCLDVPFPPDYGGAIDMFYKIKHLAAHGIKIHLHCFKYGRDQSSELEKYCITVNYYKRKTGLRGISNWLPYIVNSRNVAELNHRLLQDDHPILLEGIHCTYPLYKGYLNDKKVFVRLHNVEFQYYRQMADSAIFFLKKIYFLTESRLLKRYELALCKKAPFFAMSRKDRNTYGTMGAIDIEYLPAFQPYDKVESEIGSGTFCLYHGNLEVAENIKAVTWLISIFKNLKVPFVIAGKMSDKKFQQVAEENENICVIANPSNDEMNDLIGKAHINVLASCNSAGVKIKLLTSLFKGRHCIVDTNTVGDTGLDMLCHICNKEEELKEKVESLMQLPFTDIDKHQREKILEERYNNDQNALDIIQAIY